MSAPYHDRREQNLPLSRLAAYQRTAVESSARSAKCARTVTCTPSSPSLFPLPLPLWRDNRNTSVACTQEGLLRHPSSRFPPLSSSSSTFPCSLAMYLALPRCHHLHPSSSFSNPPRSLSCHSALAPRRPPLSLSSPFCFPFGVVSNSSTKSFLLLFHRNDVLLCRRIPLLSPPCSSLVVAFRSSLSNPNFFLSFPLEVASVSKEVSSSSFSWSRQGAPRPPSSEASSRSVSPAPRRLFDRHT